MKMMIYNVFILHSFLNKEQKKIKDNGKMTKIFLTNLNINYFNKKFIFDK